MKRRGRTKQLRTEN